MTIMPLIPAALFKKIPLANTMVRLSLTDPPIIGTEELIAYFILLIEIPSLAPATIPCMAITAENTVNIPPISQEAILLNISATPLSLLPGSTLLTAAIAHAARIIGNIICEIMPISVEDSIAIEGAMAVALPCAPQAANRVITAGISVWEKADIPFRLSLAPCILLKNDVKRTMQKIILPPSKAISSVLPLNIFKFSITESRMAIHNREAKVGIACRIPENRI